MTAGAAARWTCWSSAAGRPAWRWATTWRERDLRFLIVDSGPEIGSAWRSRWDSLRLFTSGRYDNLPGLPFPAAADTYPGKDDVADYLRAYAAEFELPVRLDTTVTSLTRAGDGSYLVKAGADALEARPGGRRHRPVPGAVHPAGRGGTPAGRASAPQRRLPAPRAAAAGTGARRRRGELRLPDRPRAVRDPGRWTSRSASASPPCRSGRWAGTSGGGPRACGWTG